ncbi:MAG: hypothetical protein ABSD28_19820 [Tepidisphaeraceae bacterium]|jgi:hypothetical protein
MDANPAAETFAKVGFGLARVVGTFEDWLSLVFAATVTLSGTFGLVARASEWEGETPPERAIIVIWAIGWITLDCWYTARLILIAVRRRRPFALTAACERWMWPLLLRPVVVLWWLGHFIVGALSAATLHFLAFRNTAQNTRVLDVLMAAGFGFAANGFLMLAVCAATRSARVRLIVWRFRAAIDIALAFIGVLLSQLVRSQMP